MVWSTAIITGLLFFAYLFAHELSHAVIAKARGIPVHKITLDLTTIGGDLDDASPTLGAKMRQRTTDELDRTDQLVTTR